MSDSESRSTRSEIAGECPRCHSPVPQTAIIIEYEVDERTASYAACPACEDVVAPT